MDKSEIQRIIQEELRKEGGRVPNHTHNGVDSPLLHGALMVDVTDTAIITLDISVSEIQTILLGGNRTLSVIRAKVGEVFLVSLTQDSVGSRTVTWFDTIRWAGGIVPTLTTTADKRDTFGFICMGSNLYDGFIIGQDI